MMFAALYAPSLPAAALVDVARAFTPRFEQLGPVVLLDANGLSRLFGSAQELGEHLRDALEKLSPGDEAACPERDGRHAGRAERRVEGRIAIASTQTAATLLALGSPGLTVVMPGKEAIALAPLGVSVLDQFERLTESAPPVPSPKPSASAKAMADGHAPSPNGETGGWHHPRTTHQASRGKRRAPDNRLLEILTKWGIRTLGALTELSGPEIHERLGDRGALWQSLARGVDARPMVPWVDEIPFEAALELEWPIEGLEPLSFVLARLLEPLAERLERADRGAAILYTSLRLTSRTVFTRTLQLPSALRDPKTLRTLILLDLESHPPDAPIDIVRVFIEPTPAKVVQWTLLERAQPAVEQVTTLLARLTALMGESHVGSPVLVDTWKPGAFEMRAFRTGNSEGTSLGTGNTEPVTVKAALRRFRFPIPTRVTVSEGRPVRVQTDRQGFSSGAIVQSAGPWRTSGHWWDTPGPRQKSERGSDAWDRDEWDVAMQDGAIYRLVVEREVGQWFLEGVID
jgi:protein ImuB